MTSTGVVSGPCPPGVDLNAWTEERFAHFARTELRGCDMTESSGDEWAPVARERAGARYGKGGANDVETEPDAALVERVARALHVIDCQNEDADRARAGLPSVAVWADPWRPCGARQLGILRRRAAILLTALATLPDPRDAEIARLRSDNERLREAVAATDAYHDALASMRGHGPAGYDYAKRLLDTARTRHEAARAALPPQEPDHD